MKEKPTPISADPNALTISEQDLPHQAGRPDKHHENYQPLPATQVETSIQRQLEARSKELADLRAESQTLLRQFGDLYDLVPIGYFTLTRNGTIRQANFTGARLLGAERNSLKGGRFGSFVSRETRPIFNTFLEEAGTEGHKCEIAILKEGEPPAWVQLEAGISQDGQELRMVAVDIGARKLAEQALNAERELFKKCFYASPITQLLIKLPERTIIDVNPAFEQAFGYSRTEMIGRSISEFNLWADASERQRVVEVLHATGQVQGYEFSFLTKSGGTGYGVFS